MDIPCVAQGPSRPPPAPRSRPSPAPPPPCWYTSRQHTWPSLLSPAAHPVTSDGVSPLQPHVPLPPIPPRPILSHPMVSPLFSPTAVTYLYPPYPRPPRDQQGNLVLQPGDCCLLILQRLCIKWWGGGFVCVSVCVCARALSHACMHRRMWAHTAHAYTRRHTHSGPCPCWDATQASGLSLARKKRRLSVESMGNPRQQA